MIRVIVDTNVFVSGIFWSGPPNKILKSWQVKKIQLIISPDIFQEYNRVAQLLSRKYSSLELSSIMNLCATYSEWHQPLPLEEPVSRDPDDDKFIACAISAGVKVIVSGDRDLLVVSGYQNLEIISPAEFAKRYLN